MPDLLIELLSEEIPARMQTRAAEDLKRLVTDGLVDAGLTYGGARAFATPRRLTLAIDGLLGESPAMRTERKGPRTDAPDKALEGFLRSTGLSRDQLEARDDKKGQVYFAVIERPGRSAADIVAEVLTAAIREFPWPKSMRWGAGALRWVRPLRSVLCLLTTEAGAEIVPVEIDGIVSADATSGHPFMAPGTFSVTSFEDYAVKLKRAHVILSADDRAAQIWHDAETLAFAQGLELVEDAGLLAEVAGLVEWPVVLMGEIEEAFLGLPPEVPKTSMKEHQKFFSVRDSKTKRIERFITVANIETPDDGALILKGNQKVLAARLSDAKFFWENDLRTVHDRGLAGMAAPLAGVTFHNQLGSQAQRIDRIAMLARDLAPAVGADAETAEQAARVAKADLASEMVYEFPELQGTMGRYYAAAQGLANGIPEACEDHYSPLGPTDDVPTAPVSVAVALADKIDLLTGFWAIGEKPTGSKDPFALRRAALGVIRIVLASDRSLPLDRVFDTQLLRHKIDLHQESAEPGELAALEDVADAIAEHGVFGAAFRTIMSALETPEEPAKASDNGLIRKVSHAVSDISDDLLGFIHERLKVHLRGEGLRHDVIDAVIAMPRHDDLVLLVKRAQALSAVLATDDGENLALAFRRANNILTQAQDKDGVEYSFGADPKFARAEEERALFVALDAAEKEIAAALEKEDFEAAMHVMAALRQPIDAFFEAVQVNTDQQTVRRNRLNLLHRICGICLSVADLRRLEG